MSDYQLGCIHGSLKRSCLVCELESERDRLEKAFGERNREIARLKAELASSELSKTNLADWCDCLRGTINDYLNERANKADLKLALTSWTNSEPQCRECGENHARD